MEQYPDLTEFLKSMDNSSGGIPTVLKYWWFIPLGLVILLIFEIIEHQTKNIVLGTRRIGKHSVEWLLTIIHFESPKKSRPA